MARRAEYDDDMEDDDDQRADWDDDQDDTIPCPHCHREIYEDAERCPHCGNYLSDEDSPATTKPWWIILGFVLCMLIVYWWIRHP